MQPSSATLLKKDTALGAKNTTVSSFDYFYSYIEDAATKILFSQLIATLVQKFKFCMSKILFLTFISK